MQLHELVYVCLATKEMSIVELTEMLEQARAKNARLDVTGLLVYHNGEFMQLLEGEKEAIFELYETICKDDRNEKNYLMWEGPLKSRSFPDWAMAFVPLDGQPLADQPAYSDFLQTGRLYDPDGGHDSIGREFLVTLRDDFLRKG